MVSETNKRWGILYCPRDGFFKTHGKRWERIEKVLRDRGIEFDFVQGERARNVERLVTMMISNGYRTIVVVGGDSALNDAVNCLMQVDRQVRDSIVLGVIPNGMMNDFAHFWNFDENDIERTVDWLKARRVRRIDLGCIRYRNSRKENCHRYFLNCVNVGLIAAIMNLRRRTFHLFGSRTLSFFFSFILLVFQRMEYLMDMKINTDRIRRKVMTVCVGNSHGYGQTPNAVPYNGLLDVSVVYHSGMTQLFEGICLFVRGKFLNHKSVHPYRTREVCFNTAQHAMVGVDGRLMNGAPVGAFRITVEHEVINFLIPG